MKEFIEKLIGRLDKKIHLNPVDEYEKGYSNASCDAIDDINELAEEYNNGWIPCSERLPSKEEYLKNDGRFIVTDGNRRYQSIFDIYSQKFRTSIFTTFGSYEYKEDKCVIAWQSLPQPYKVGVKNDY